MPAISMRELQTLSASAIAALPGIVPIKDGAEAVALLSPVAPLSPDEIDRLIADLHDAHAGWTDERRAQVDRFLQDRGVDF